jgi:hypothetical protein
MHLSFLASSSRLSFLLLSAILAQSKPEASSLATSVSPMALTLPMALLASFSLVIFALVPFAFPLLLFSLDFFKARFFTVYRLEALLCRLPQWGDYRLMVHYQSPLKNLRLQQP